MIFILYLSLKYEIKNMFRHFYLKSYNVKTSYIFSKNEYLYFKDLPYIILHKEKICILYLM